MRTPSRALAAAVTVALVAMVAGCGTDDPPASSGVSSEGIRLYGSDGNMNNRLGANLDETPGVLSGMKGTALLAPVPSEFQARLRAVYPGLTDYNYSAQTYDAVVITALAAEIARTTKGTEIGKFVPGVSIGTDECRTVAACLSLIKRGRDIAYRGMSLRRGGFTDAGEPSTGTYGTLHFSRDNRIDDGKTEYVGAGNESDTTQNRQPVPPSPTQEAQDGPLVFGGLLPKSGQLAGAYPPLGAGARLAIKELNDAGGVLGEKVQWIDGDDGTNPDVAKATVERLISEKVHVIIGAGASGVSKVVIPRVTGAGIVMISPSATSDELSTLPDNNLFFRTAAPDHLQARALADIVLRDGLRRVLLVARDDSYGQGLMKNLRTNLEGSGLKPTDITVYTYQPGASAEDKPNVADLPKRVKDFAPDGIVIMGFDETAHIIGTLVKAEVRLHD